jgi:hypothetical protein
VIVVKDEGKGASYARNKGVQLLKEKNGLGEYLICSDNDIQWTINGIKHMVDTLKEHPEASYAYGSYRIEHLIQCTEEFDPDILKRHNYISTMSVIRSKDFPGFDESLKRLQDWDLWLNLLINHGKTGINCGKLTFHTPYRPGITSDSEISELDAVKVIKKKYHLEAIPYP